MKTKKILSALVAGAALVAFTFSFAACSDSSHRNESVFAKKGVCVSRYNDGLESSARKVEALNPSWYYTWGVRSENEHIDAEFVPMVWGGWQMNENDLSYIKENYESGKFTHLLTFNEPDLPDQANMTVETALGYWAQLEEIGIPLSSPVVSSYYYQNGQPQNDATRWLDEFMQKAEERNLRVDFIAVHSYQPFNYEGMAKSLKEDTLDILYEKYHKPLWLTEFGAIDIMERDVWHTGHLTEGCDLEGARRYIQETTDMLESCDYVERYSWFLDNWNGQNRPYDAEFTYLYNNDDTISEVGEIYRDVPSGKNNR